MTKNTEHIEKKLIELKILKSKLEKYKENIDKAIVDKEYFESLNLDIPVDQIVFLKKQIELLIEGVNSNIDILENLLIKKMSGNSINIEEMMDIITSKLQMFEKLFEFEKLQKNTKKRTKKRKKKQQ